MCYYEKNNLYQIQPIWKSIRVKLRVTSASNIINFPFASMGYNNAP